MISTHLYIVNCSQVAWPQPFQWNHDVGVQEVSGAWIQYCRCQYRGENTWRSHWGDPQKVNRKFMQYDLI